MDAVLTFGLGFFAAFLILAGVILVMGFIAFIVHSGPGLLTDQLQAVTTVEVLMSVDDRVYRADDWIALHGMMVECGDVDAPLDQLFNLVRTLTEGQPVIADLSRHLEHLLLDELARRGYCHDESIHLSVITDAIEIGVSVD